MWLLPAMVHLPTLVGLRSSECQHGADVGDAMILQHDADPQAVRDTPRLPCGASAWSWPVLDCSGGVFTESVFGYCMGGQHQPPSSVHAAVTGQCCVM